MLRAIFTSFFIGLLSTLTLSILILWQTETIDIWLLLTNLLTFIALGYCYFHFINMGTTARRFRIMSELNSSSNGLTLDQIKKCYNSSEMIGHRIRRLIDNHQATYVDGYYNLTPSLMKIIAICFYVGKRLVFGKRNLATQQVNE